MRKLLTLLILAAGVVMGGIVMFRRQPKGPEAEALPPAPEAPPAATPATNHSSFYTKRVRRQPSQALPNQQPAEMSATATNLIAAWEVKVDEILEATTPDQDKARQMLEIFPQLPPDGQEDVARHLSNLLPDEDYGLLRKYLTNPDLPENVLDALLDDALNRPNSLKLPALLEVARNPQNPKAAEAKDFLELFLEQDYGTDWAAWQARMEQWLKENPD